MTVYVDSEHIHWRGRTWCHLVADSTGELHAFAQRLGLKAQWFQSRSVYPHYDVTSSMQQRALCLGARLADRRTIVECGRRMRDQVPDPRQSGSFALAMAGD